MSADVLLEQVKNYIQTSEEACQALEAFLIERTSAEKDWWDDTHQAIKDALLKSREASARGEGTKHEEMKKRYPQWFRL